ncbi:M20 family metallo-hydrolase [Saccharomycodes ludwigii]|uniref:M20 family metallo-hydrolase n=1 Tax=Saccharomycodes ludwigii TaxID=36035 RepID=UPI001E88EE72|nr:conserved putative beta-alanine synthase [Saccharomycodes ludwigii]KAH3898800.1 conserved putative beta-alanine synthase [Saccharomycodes ludwigii]
MSTTQSNKSATTSLPVGTLSLPGIVPLDIVSGRLNDTIINTGEQYGGLDRWGPARHEFGMRRLAGTKVDGEMRTWFINQCKNLGCSIKIDKIGNIFAIFPGKNSGELPTGIGSHLDTQPAAGKYDGILGVLAGLEVLRTFKENNYVPNYDVCVVCWFNEEGARFPMACTGSSVWAHALPLKEAYELMSIGEDTPESVYESLTNTGYLGDIDASYESGQNFHGIFELHIEQGPILENEKKDIGIVVGVQSWHWQKIIVTGQGAHAGTTPWELRHDALLASSKMIIAANKLAKKYKGLFTCGVIDALPYSVNIIPGEVSFTTDFRHTSDETLKQIVKEATEEFAQIITEEGCEIKTEILQYNPAVHFNKTCIECVSRSAYAQFPKDKVRTITSGAGHDSCLTSLHCPTSMIFIPSKNGLSHNYHEYSSPEEIENGFKVLLQAVINYDNHRAAK